MWSIRVCLAGLVVLSVVICVSPGIGYLARRIDTSCAVRTVDEDVRLEVLDWGGTAPDGAARRIQHGPHL